MKIADIIKRNRRVSVIAVLTCAVIAVCAAAADAGKTMDKAVAQEEAARQAQLDDLAKQTEQAVALQKNGKFEDAFKTLNGVGEKLKTIPGTLAEKMLKDNERDILSLRHDWSAAVMEQARAQAKEQKYEEGIALASTAGTIDQRRNDEVNKFKAWSQEKIADRDYVAATNVKNFDPTYLPNQEKIKSLYLEATIYFNNGRYTDAVSKLQEIYVLDPLNSKATFLLDKCYRKVYPSMVDRVKAQAKAITAAGTWTWVEPIKANISGDKLTRQVEVKSNGNTLLDRMENIVFPLVEFENSDILSALRYLQSNSKRYDALGQGVTIIPQLNIAKSAKTTEPGAGAGADADGAKTEERSLPLVSMNFTNIPMIDVLRYLCQDAGMGFRIDADSVIVGYGVESADMQSRSYGITPTLYSSIMGGEGAAGETAAAAPAAGGALTAGTDTAAASTATTSADSAKIKEYFSKRGIEFGEGTQISYNSRTRKITMRNTAANLRRMEDLIRQLSVIATPLVMTEIKMVKITETDLEQLGFQWTFSSSRNDAVIGGTTQNSIRSGTALQAVMDKFPEDTSLIGNLKIFPNLIQGNDFNLQFSVNALSQHNSAEILSAPKLISTSGVEATIKMVDRTRYPESWDKPEITTNGDNNASVTKPLPTFGENTDTGIELTLRPSVNPDNYTIKLELHPKATTAIRGGDAKSDNTYGVIIDRGYYDDNGNKISYSDYPQYYYVWLPEFDEQSLDVTMKVFDGETVVFGGITSGTTRRIEDKIPLLGDIPLIGRLFMSKSEQNVKTNLLFFVTARLINSDGLPMRRSENRGVPQFN